MPTAIIEFVHFNAANYARYIRLIDDYMRYIDAYINAKDITEDGIEIDREINLDIKEGENYTPISRFPKESVFYVIELKDRETIDGFEIIYEFFFKTVIDMHRCCKGFPKSKRTISVRYVYSISGSVQDDNCRIIRSGACVTVFIHIVAIRCSDIILHSFR